MAVTLITPTAYSRHRGCDEKAVRKAIAAGRISTIDGLIDPVVADIQWRANTRARIGSSRPSTDAPVQASAPPAVAVPTDADEYSVNRARRERLEADLAEIRLLEQTGDLVRVAEVRAEIGKRVGQLRTNLLQLSARLAHVLDAEQRAAVDAEIRSALTGAGQEVR